MELIKGKIPLQLIGRGRGFYPEELFRKAQPIDPAAAACAVVRHTTVAVVLQDLKNLFGGKPFHGDDSLGETIPNPVVPVDVGLYKLIDMFLLMDDADTKQILFVPQGPHLGCVRIPGHQKLKATSVVSLT